MDDPATILRAAAFTLNALGPVLRGLADEQETDGEFEKQELLAIADELWACVTRLSELYKSEHDVKGKR